MSERSDLQAPRSLKPRHLGRRIEITIPEEVEKEWQKRGFSCTTVFTPEEEGGPTVTMVCEPLEDSSREGVGGAIRSIIKAHGNVLGSWSEDMPRWVKRCIKAGGLPVFRTRFAGARWGGNMVLAACYGDEEPPIAGGFFKNVPEEDIAKMEEAAGDWKWIVEKYGDEELKKYVRERYVPPKLGLAKFLRELSRSRKAED